MTALVVVLAASLNGSPFAAYAASVAAHHKRADVFVKKQDLSGAIAEMRAAVALKAPDDPRALELVLDAYGRLGDLLVKAGRPADAVAVSRDGIARTKEPSAFLARLYVVLGDALAGSGKDDEALDAYQHAIDVNAQLMKAVVADGGSR